MDGAPDPRRVEELFDDAADLSPDAAAALLDRECAGNAALRAAVERLLDCDRRAPSGPLLIDDALRAEALGGALAEAAPAPPSEPPPARVGRYALLRRLGEGGMGVVHEGHDEGLDRRVAVKLLRRGRAAEDWLRREAQALARLAHPNVVHVHEIGEHEGRIYIAMELVEGQTLREWLEAGPRPLPEVLSMFLSVGRGLEAAHAAGVVHRDMKPDNVLIGPDGRARLVDFGIAALDAAPASTHPGAADTGARPPGARLTRAGALLGTPAFMAPEQLRGERATAASDQFSFCVALYRAVFGQAPFPGDDLGALRDSTRADAVRPPPPGCLAPAWLHEVILRGLAPDPAARFPSMAALVAAIERRLPRDPELDPSTTRSGRRLIAAAMLAVLAALDAWVYLRGAGRALTTPWDLVRMAAALVALTAGAALLLRRRLAKNLYGLRIAALYVLLSAALLAHRLLAAQLGAPVPAVIAVDLLIFAAVFGCAAITLVRWLAWPALLSLSAAIIAAWAPGWAAPVMTVTNASILALVILLWEKK